MIDAKEQGRERERKKETHNIGARHCVWLLAHVKILVVDEVLVNALAVEASN